MRKQFLYAAVMIAISGCERGNPVAPIQDAPKYLPLAAGNTWTYDNTTNYGGRDTTLPLKVDLQGPIEIDGLKWYGVNNFCVNMRLMSPLPLFCALWARDGNKVLSQQNGPGPSLLVREVMLDFPLVEGKEWVNASVDTTYVSYGDTIHYEHHITRMVTGVETISVPAGMFSNCFHIVDHTLTLNATKHAGSFHTYTYSIVTDEWFALNVGMVKQNIIITSESNDTPQVTNYENRVLREYHVEVSN